MLWKTDINLLNIQKYWSMAMGCRRKLISNSAESCNWILKVDIKLRNNQMISLVKFGLKFPVRLKGGKTWQQLKFMHQVFTLHPLGYMYVWPYSQEHARRFSPGFGRSPNPGLAGDSKPRGGHRQGGLRWMAQSMGYLLVACRAPPLKSREQGRVSWTHTSP